MDIFQQLILGMIQGIVEWLPFSSEGFLLLANTHFFGEINLELFLRQALFLHLGTFFAALIYFRKDVKELFHGMLNYSRADPGEKRTIKFLAIATIISGVLGLALITFVKIFEQAQNIVFSSRIVTFIVGFFLIITGLLQIKSVKGGIRNVFHLNNTDSIITGIAQGFSVLPGLSRSGLTVSVLLLRNINDSTALRLSFLLSLPIVLIGNILWNFSDFVFMGDMLWGLLFSFLFGILTIHLLMRFAHKVKFGHFVLVIGTIMILSSFVSLPFLS